MRPIHFLVFVALCLAGCGGASPIEETPEPTKLEATLAWQQLDDAVRVWRLGAEAWQPPPPREPEQTDTEEVAEEEIVETDSDLPFDLDRVRDESFTRLDAATARLIETPYLDSAVQFGCSITSWPREYRLTKALREGTPELRLLALTILMRVKAPRTVREQWKALEELQDMKGHDELSWLLDELWLAFSEPAVRTLIQRSPPKDRYADDYPLEWACRATGVRRHWALLPRLVTLSRWDQLNVSLAAQASLEDFPGPEGDDALASCLLGWQYDAYERSASALLTRNPALLERALLDASPPKKCVYLQGVFLGRLGNPAAVSLLCQELPGHQIIDREMFDLVEQLARREHVVLVDALPDQVRTDQQPRAHSVRVKVRTRLGLPTD